MTATAIKPHAGLEAPIPVDASDVKTLWQQLALALFIAVPFAALTLVAPVRWGW
jgi:hypothetical protein